MPDKEHYFFITATEKSSNVCMQIEHFYFTCTFQPAKSYQIEKKYLIHIHSKNVSHIPFTEVHRTALESRYTIQILLTHTIHPSIHTFPTTIGHIFSFHSFPRSLFLTHRNLFLEKQNTPSLGSPMSVFWVRFNRLGLWNYQCHFVIPSIHNGTCSLCISNMPISDWAESH